MENSSSFQIQSKIGKTHLSATGSPSQLHNPFPNAVGGQAFHESAVLQTFMPCDDDLQNLISRLTTLSRLLDYRAKSLHVAEAHVVTERKVVQEHQAALNSVEASARQHISDLLNDMATRQKFISNRESRLVHMRHVLESRLCSARDLLSEAADIDRQLPSRRAELADLRHQLGDHLVALEDARAALADARAQREHALCDTQTLIEDRGKLEIATEHLKTLSAKLKERETILSRREAEINSRHTSVVKFSALQRVVAPLQSLLDDLAAIDGVPAPDVASDVAGAADVAVLRLADVRANARSVSEMRSQLEIKLTQLEERTHSLHTELKSLRERQTAVSLDEQRVVTIQRTLDRTRLDAESAMRIADETRVQLEARDESIRSREEQLLVMEEDITRRETAVAITEQTLSRKERSISRTLATVEMRERALNERIRDLEGKRLSFESMHKELEIREKLLHTREVELTACHSRDQTAKENLLTKGKANNHDDIQEFHLRNSAEPAVPPDTVRRQLAFGSSKPNISHSEIPSALKVSQSGNGPTDKHGPSSDWDTARARMVEEDAMHQSNDESEVAAEQLFPELLGVRMLWKQRVQRLKDVVCNMREHLTMQPHIDGTLESVQQVLQTLYNEIEVTSSWTLEAVSPSEAYAKEQHAQVLWCSSFRQQLDVVREVQTGMLIASRPITDKESACTSKKRDQDDDAGMSGNSADTVPVNTSFRDGNGRGLMENSLGIEYLHRIDKQSSRDRSCWSSIETTLDATVRLDSSDSQSVTTETGTRTTLDGRHSSRTQVNTINNDSMASVENELPFCFSGKISSPEAVHSASENDIRTILYTPYSGNIITELTMLRNELQGLCLPDED